MNEVKPLASLARPLTLTWSIDRSLLLSVLIGLVCPQLATDFAMTSLLQDTKRVAFRNHGSCWGGGIGRVMTSFELKYVSCVSPARSFAQAYAAAGYILRFALGSLPALHPQLRPFSAEIRTSAWRILLLRLSRTFGGSRSTALSA